MPLALGETATGVERTPDGRRLVVKRAVEAQPETVWDVLTDTEQWPEWGPSISAVDADTRYIEHGSRGRIRLLGTVWLSYEITSCADHRWTWDVARIDATGHFVSTHRDGAVVGFELPVLGAGYVPICRRACARIGRLASEQRG
jgi:hypothetical protein